MLSAFPIVASLLAAGTLSGQNRAVVFHPDEQTRHPSVVGDSRGHLHLAYLAHEKDKQVEDVFHAVSADGGNTWNTAIEVSKTPGQSSDPVIAGHGQNLAIVWIDTTAGAANPDVWAAVSSNDGVDWTAAADISKTPGVSSEPAVAIAPDGTIHVVWLDTTGGAANPDVWHTQSDDYGKSWKAAENISKTPGVSSHTAIACGPKGEVYVTWADTTNGVDNRDIWFARSLDGGKTWGKPFDMSNTPGLSSTPEIAVGESGKIYVSWIDTSSGATHPDVFVVRSHDRGATFSKPVDASNTPGVSSEPAMAAADGALVIVWLETPSGSSAVLLGSRDHPAASAPPVPDIWFAQSGDGGRTFSAAANLSNTPGGSGLPRVAIVANAAVAAWEEEEEGAYHVKLAYTPAITPNRTVPDTKVPAKAGK